MHQLNRKSHLCRLEEEAFDLLIIGGGITGACLAYDAATRGIRTALIEKSDFGHATSAASSKLLHGGIRFLQQLRFDKVRESAFERVYFQNLAPHLCRYIPFLVPTFRGLKSGKTFLAAGAAAYTAIAAGQNTRVRHKQSRVPLPKLIGRDDVINSVPWLGSDWKGTGALVLPECHMKSSERMTLALVHAAADAGAVVANYIKADRIDSNADGVKSVSVVTEDGASFEVGTNIVANCAGPWLGEVDGLAAGKNVSPISSFFRGSHLVLNDMDLDCALALPTPQKIQGVTSRGGRHVFLIPWRRHVLLGTSYAPHNGDLDEVAPTDADAEQLLDAVNAALGTKTVTEDRVAHAFAGIYPIVASAVKKDEYQGATDFMVTDHGQLGGPRGYFSVFGAKFTTARKLAEVACNAIAKQVDRKTGPCVTRESTLDVADISDPEAYCADLGSRYANDVDDETVRHLYENFGTDSENILRMASREPNLFRRIAENREDIAAVAVFCARNEMLVHLDDFVFRRTGLGTIGFPGHAAIQCCADLIAAELGWSANRIRAEVETTLAKFPRLDRKAA